MVTTQSAFQGALCGKKSKTQLQLLIYMEKAIPTII